MDSRDIYIAVVVPCYRVGEKVLGTIAGVGPEVTHIFVVDDACPARTGDLVEERVSDARVAVIRHDVNQGVGGAVVSGYRASLEAGASVVVKLDGDGQADPALIPLLIAPLLNGECDYVKGNRFFNPEDLAGMPIMRLVGNAALSFVTKMSTGYWNVMDPTNGFTAISVPVLHLLPLAKLSKGYFFESDILFRLNTIRAVVRDFPMRSTYEGNTSSLVIPRIIPQFLRGHVRNAVLRIIYGYFLRGFSIASIELVLSIPLLVFGMTFGLYHWFTSVANDSVASAGTVMIAAMPILVGTQLLLSFINHDMQNEPRVPLSGSVQRPDT